MLRHRTTSVCARLWSWRTTPLDLEVRQWLLGFGPFAHQRDDLCPLLVPRASGVEDGDKAHGPGTYGLGFGLDRMAIYSHGDEPQCPFA